MFYINYISLASPERVQAGENRLSFHKHAQILPLKLPDYTFPYPKYNSHVMQLGISDI